MSDLVCGLGLGGQDKAITRAFTGRPFAHALQADPFDVYLDVGRVAVRLVNGDFELGASLKAVRFVFGDLFGGRRPDCGPGDPFHVFNDSEGGFKDFAFLDDFILVCIWLYSAIIGIMLPSVAAKQG
jgi:hypothetical protein